ncbi:betaine-aldehyde dehydrogenase [Paraburkholderia hospita]|uniref:aldehyde dehydrogenase (NAD(+)) n=1 Tax=Paraburkholderia hospita TaxID=169430 RepID=A0ABP2PD97_9BURK|nr:aldehyde dehydrogenase family protein [Paraburkholderia hospita]EIM95842.1 betaine-aldehyde dehydrogenase [Paraburkholderia hospita]OUL70603.1 aldehyde dehydrogenase [Paraburkholderia hospita]OUL91043.1 aldehyde dehydrogenase [Paraburkholderia hospita]
MNAPNDTQFLTRHYIDGRWVDGALGRTIAVVNPATGAHLADVAAGTAHDVDLAVASAGRALRVWRQTTGAERARYLRAIVTEVEARRERLAMLQSLNNGKPQEEAHMDVDDVIATFRYYAQLAERLDDAAGEEVSIPSAEHRARMCREPCGVAALIVPWNFPMVTTAWKLAPALAAGCTVVLKPSEITPLPELELASALASVGLPAGVFNAVTGTGADVGASLVAHPGVAKVSFTGSTGVGQTVMKTAADTLKGVSLELGGKSSIVVFDDADLDLAVKLVEVGGFFNSGQMCSATSRVLVARELAPTLLAKLVECAERIIVGDPFAPGVQMGPLVNRAQFDRVRGHIEQGIADGARLVTGGGARPVGVPEQGFFIAPTIFADVPPTSALWRDEIFGPVLCVRVFDTEQEAVEFANDSEYGLVATVVTADETRGERVARALEAGVVWVNTPQLIYPQTSWGGYKRSSIGRELGPFGLAAFQEIKQILTRRQAY